MFVRGVQGGVRQVFLCAVHTPLPRYGLATLSRWKWTSSLGSGFDGSSFSDDEDSPYDAARKLRFGYGEPGSVTYKGNEDAMIDEINKELDTLFGAAPPAQPGTSSGLQGRSAPEEQLLGRAWPSDRARTDSRNDRGMKVKAQPSYSASKIDSDSVFDADGNQLSVAMGLSHVDAAGKAAMVNVAKKNDTRRTAVAIGRVFLGPQAFSLVAANSIAKGDVLTVAKIAGIMGAKQTANFIPLCHPLLLSGVDLSLTLDKESYSVEIEAKVSTVGSTGVEMEALTAVTVACLTVYDMCKSVSKDIKISDIQLQSKTGAKVVTGIDNEDSVHLLCVTQ